MNQAADNERESAIHKSTIDGKQATKDFDVYLCYNDADQSTVECKGEELKEQGILPWFDAWELKPGSLEQRIREKQIRQTKSVAIFIGGKGINSRQDLELQACIRKFTEQKDYVVIPVLLEDYTDEIELPEFLKNIFPVDFRRTKPNQMELLCKAIPTRNVDEEIDPEEPPEDERPGKHRDIKTM